MSENAASGVAIAHVALTVSDLERSVRFYRDNFGFTRQETIRVEAEDLTICLLQAGGVVLELFAYGSSEPLPDYRRTPATDLRTIGTKHLALATADIATVYARLAANGVTLATELRVFAHGLRYFFVADPDGILVEIMERTTPSL